MDELGRLTPRRIIRAVTGGEDFPVNPLSPRRHAKQIGEDSHGGKRPEGPGSPNKKPAARGSNKPEEDMFPLPPAEGASLSPPAHSSGLGEGPCGGHSSNTRTTRTLPLHHSNDDDVDGGIEDRHRAIVESGQVASLRRRAEDLERRVADLEEDLAYARHNTRSGRPPLTTLHTLAQKPC